MCVLCVISTLAGVAIAAYDPSMWALAGILPTNFTPATSLGKGCASMIWFFVWMIISKVMFLQNVVGVRSSVWLIFVLGATINLSGIILYHVVVRRPWAVEAVKKAGRELREAPTKTNRDEDGSCGEEGFNLQPRKPWVVFKDVAESIIVVWFTLWITYMVMQLQLLVLLSLLFSRCSLFLLPSGLS